MPAAEAISGEILVLLAPLSQAVRVTDAPMEGKGPPVVPSTIEIPFRLPLRLH